MKNVRIKFWQILLLFVLLAILTMIAEKVFFWNPAIERMKLSLNEKDVKMDFSNINSVKFRYYHQILLEKNCDFNKIDCWDGIFPNDSTPIYTSIYEDKFQIFRILKSCENCRIYEGFNLDLTNEISEEDVKFQKRDVKCYAEDSIYWNNICTRFSYNKNNQVVEILHTIIVEYPKFSWLKLLGGLGYIPEYSIRYDFLTGVKQISNHNNGWIKTRFSK